MIKRITFILLMYLSVISFGYSQVQVGTGTNTEQKVPYNAQFGLSYSQSIYLSSEINASGTISTIQWYYNGNGLLDNSQNLAIYIGNTTKTVFANSNDWEPVANLTLVYTGGITTNSAPGWKTITLDTPFVYNGTSNLIVAVDDNQEGSDNYNDKFFNSPVSGIRSMAVWGDSNDINPANPPEAYADYGGFVAYVPNIIFGGISQACPTPSYVAVSNVTTDSATISWQAPTTSPTGGSDYYVSTSSTDPTAATVPTGSIASGVTFNVSALTPATTYYVWVRNNCGDGLYSNWSAVTSFITDCIGVSAFVEDFDEVTIPNLPLCWNKIIRSSVFLDPNAALINTYDSFLTIKSPPNFVVLHADASVPADTEIILVSPNLSNLSSNNHRLKFWAAGNNTSLKIGTLSTNDNTAVFTELVGNEVTINSTPTEYVVDFSGYTGTDHYIGIKLVGNINNFFNNFANLDNIVWEPLPVCPDVTEINATATSTNAATIEWTAGTGEAETTSFDIAVGTSSNSIPDGPYLTSTDPLKEITGLEPNTTYYVWVRTVCHDINGAWIGPISFKTACLPIANFYENFNNSDTPNLPDCWSKIIAGPTVSQYAWVDTNQYSGMFSSSNIAVEMNVESSGDSPDNKVMLVSPNLSTLSLGTYRLKFYAKSGNGTNVEIVTLNNNTPSATITVVQDIVLTDATTQYVVEFDNPTTDTYIGFRLKDAGFYGGIFIDNILWEESPSCADVTAINVPSTTPNTADITWTAGESEVSWDIAVGSSTDEDPTGLTFVSSTTTTKTVTGLNANTSYNVWVRSVCAGNDNGAWIGPVAFTTACDAVDAFVETFQNAEMPELPACWGKIITGNTDYPGSIETQISYMPNETTAVLLKNKESEQVILVSPNLTTLSLGTYRLKFVAKGDQGLLEIGTLSSATDSAVFSPLATINTTSTPTEYTVPFDGYTGTDTYIGIRVSNTIQYQYIEMDNIIWQPIPLCPDVDQLSVVETTTTSGTIVWEPGTASNWQIAVGSTSDTDPDSLAPYIASTNPDYEIAGLTAGTSYNVWVRSVCEGSLGNGYWTGPIVVTTQCDATTVPYLQDFESAATPNLPACTSAYNLSDGPYNWYTGYYPGNGFENTTLIYNGDCCTDANAWFYTQGVTLTEGVNYTISYRYGGAMIDELYLNSLKVMYGTQATELFMTLPIADHEDFMLDTPVAESVTITPPTTGVYYFGFNAYSDNNSYLLFVDDILIDVALANNTFDKSKFSYYPNPVKDVLNISYEKNITAVAVYNILGQEVITKSINGNIAKVDMSALAKGAYMVKVTSDNVVKTIKIIKE